MDNNNVYTYNTLTLPDTTELAYIDIGKGGQIIIFLHGIGNVSFVWHKNIAELSKQYRCIAVDLPGNGRSSLVDMEYSLSYFADSIAFLIQQLNLQKVHLVGHSMGGQTAMVFSLKYPQLLHSLILCAPAGFEAFNAWEAKLFEVMMTFVDVSQKENHFTNAITLSFYNRPKDIGDLISATVQSLQGKDDTLYRNMLEHCVKSMVKDKISNRLREIHTHTLILFGLQDNYIPIKAIHPLKSTRSIALQAAANLPDAQLKLYESCGHSIQWEMHEEVNKDIIAFINSR